MGVIERALRLRGVRRSTIELPHGRTLSYLRAGPRRPFKTLVLVHGLGTSNLSWSRVFVRLARDHRVIAPDLPGYGHSILREGLSHATVEEHTHTLADFLESELFPEPVVLVGQSMGGWLSIKAARQVPRKVDQLVLVNSAGVRYEGIEDLRKVVSPRTRQEVLAFWESMWYRVPRYFRPFWKGASLHMQAPNVQRFLETLRPEDFVNEDLPRLEVPVSIVWGRNDRFIPVHTVDTLIDGLGSTRVYWIPRCGHIPALERSREFARLLNVITRSDAEARPTPPARVPHTGSRPTRSTPG